MIGLSDDEHGSLCMPLNPRPRQELMPFKSGWRVLRGEEFCEVKRGGWVRSRPGIRGQSREAGVGWCCAARSRRWAHGAEHW